MLQWQSLKVAKLASQRTGMEGVLGKAQLFCSECSPDVVQSLRFCSRWDDEWDSRPIKNLQFLLHCAEDYVRWLSLEPKLLCSCMEEDGAFWPVVQDCKIIHGLVSVPQQDLTELQEDLAPCGRHVNFVLCGRSCRLCTDAEKYNHSTSRHRYFSKRIVVVQTACLSSFQWFRLFAGVSFLKLLVNLVLYSCTWISNSSQPARSSRVGMGVWCRWMKRRKLDLKSCGSLPSSLETCEPHSSSTLPFLPSYSNGPTHERTHKANSLKALMSPLAIFGPSISSAIRWRANWCGCPYSLSRAAIVSE